MDKLTYDKKCKKYSNRILQRIICPKCGYVYSVEESINLGMGDDCEDVVYINCKKCNTKLRVDSWFTEIRFLTRLSKEQE